MPRPPSLHERAAMALLGRVIEIDDEGRVWRLQARGRPCARHRAEYVAADGYLLVALDVPQLGHREIPASRLVYEALRGGIPAGHIVRPANGDRADNRPGNLVAELPGFRGKVRRGAP